MITVYVICLLCIFLCSSAVLVRVSRVVSVVFPPCSGLERHRLSLPHVSPVGPIVYSPVKQYPGSRQTAVERRNAAVKQSVDGLSMFCKRTN